MNSLFPFPPESSSIRRSKILILLALILALAAFLRLWRGDEVLAGLQIDEASNAWNAYCLLNTGQDEWGKSWPVFHTRAIDDHRSPLYLYLVIPFQAIGGMNVWTTRLPAALGGVATVALVYWIGKRLFDPSTGLIAAALMAVCPWHVQHTRWGHEGSIGPLLVAMAIAAALWAGAPLADRRIRPRAWRALLAGLLAGSVCYGYGAVRIALPVALIAMFAVTYRAWCSGPSKRVRSLALIGVGFLIAVAPLVFTHLTDPNISSRGAELLVGTQGDSPISRILQAASRYPSYFGHEFLLTTGAREPTLWGPRGYGMFNGYFLPLSLLGLIVAASRWKRSRSARVLLVLLIVYPAGDLFFLGQPSLDLGPHPLRCFPGVIASCLLAALGASATGRWLWKRSPRAAYLGLAAICLWAAISSTQFFRNYFGPFKNDPWQRVTRDVDLMQACQWLKPRLAKTDRIYLTNTPMVAPCLQMLVNLQYEPASWQRGPREYASRFPPDPQKLYCVAFDKFRVVNDPGRVQREIQQMQGTAAIEHVVMILRPDERELAGDRVPSTVIEIGGVPRLLIYELEL